MSNRNILGVLMSDFEKIVKESSIKEIHNCNKYNPTGKTYKVNTKNYEGLYWFYEHKDFVIEIHDFIINKDHVITLPENTNLNMPLISTYIIYGSGEWLNPYQTIEPYSLFISGNSNDINKCILHGNQSFLSVGIIFKNYNNENIKDFSKLFISSQKSASTFISKIANEILKCEMEKPAAELFFEAKAKEWLSFSINAAKTYQKTSKLNTSDEIAIESVAKYIEDHYALNIPQQLLENIACMSGTKLKNTFKKKYNMSITEFTQRKRMNIAENLLLTSDLDINSISKTVGYNCSSRFSTLFKRYKGISPKDIKKIR